MGHHSYIHCDAQNRDEIIIQRPSQPPPVSIFTGPTIDTLDTANYEAISKYLNDEQDGATDGNEDEIKGNRTICDVVQAYRIAEENNSLQDR